MVGSNFVRALATVPNSPHVFVAEPTLKAPGKATVLSDSNETVPQIARFWKAAGRWHLTDSCPNFSSDRCWTVWYKAEIPAPRWPQPMCEWCEYRFQAEDETGYQAQPPE